ncbi:MAG TPA: DAK2 domain-containing protein [Gaiella sp.]|nr:DAK2 domain-containing protein [Gaiella sp.]
MTDLARTTRLARAALANLERHRRRINALNVYPVPDGDTGTNLTLTVRGIVEALGRSEAATAEELAAEVQRAATMEAKGNSGVILSTIVRGMAPVLTREGSLDGPRLAEALRAGTTAAYEAVTHPVEGTMLTVVREMAEEAERPETSGSAFPQALGRAVARGDQAVARTPQLLDTLRDAGVVDAGGVGLVELARGVLHELTGEPLPDVPDVVGELTDGSIHQEESVYRYCTTFVVEGDELDLDALHATLEPLGDSLLVTGDPSVAKVHVHTDEPEHVLELGRAVGVVDPARIEVSDMRSQAAERERWLAQLQAAAMAPPTTSALVAVAQGAGNREILRGEGAQIVVDGGATANPSVGQLLEAITAVNAEQVIVLPNDPNVRLAAERAADESTKEVRILATTSIPEGIAAALSFDPDADVDANAAAMQRALDGVAAAEITRASRSATVDGVEVGEGDFLALVGGRAFTTGDDIWTVLDALLARFSTDGQSFVQVLRGEGAPEADEIAARYAGGSTGLEIDVQWGGQPHYPLLLSAE